MSATTRTKAISKAREGCFTTTRQSGQIAPPGVGEAPDIVGPRRSPADLENGGLTVWSRKGRANPAPAATNVMTSAGPRHLAPGQAVNGGPGRARLDGTRDGIV